jgi:hypothetical protein
MVLSCIPLFLRRQELFHLTRVYMIFENCTFERSTCILKNFPYDLMRKNNFVILPLGGAFHRSLVVNMVLLSFSRHACHVGNRHLNDDAAGFWPFCCVLPFSYFLMKCCSLHRFIVCEQLYVFSLYWK